MTQLCSALLSMQLLAAPAGDNGEDLAKTRAKLAEAQRELARVRAQLEATIKAHAVQLRATKRSYEIRLEALKKRFNIAQIKPFEVNLPELQKPAPDQLIINVTRDGKYNCGGKDLDARKLMHYLERRRVFFPAKTALIRADRNTKWLHVVRAMGICNRVKMRYRIAATVEK